MVKDRRVVSIQHLPGARSILRDMDTVEEPTAPGPIGNSASAVWFSCLDTGMKADAATIEREYDFNREKMKQYLPIECPKMCMTKYGTLRPWTGDVNFGKQQATALQRLLRDAFWQAVGEFADDYAREHAGEKYAQQDMIEAFCQATGTSDEYVEDIRREWQRRAKRR